ncbi:hypothetical protein [Rhizobium sp. NZLR1]|uniref:hypothetical protein n=1 Tax=Rhizobium sp. NZLR1 TaxID=2731096 RepID=UPI001A98C3A1|nr:hypothetical protein [Rhizobium sp. NZLR1]MBX5204116.1 hypothetical protein [Rhizobium sp. NZLR1]QSZ25093.1 hypothetical protein J3O30_32530 [Rhizobium sp. NZLR1]
MSESHISVSNPDYEDTIGLLWKLSDRARSGVDIRSALGRVRLDGLSKLETEVCLAVRSHLGAIAKLTDGVSEDEARTGAFSRWDVVLAEVQHMRASLTPQAHAFHMRLASKYAEYYRGFEEKSLTQWVNASRLKSAFADAVAIYRHGDLEGAAGAVARLSHQWRESLPIRLPGLREIEQAGHAWAARAGNSPLADKLAANADELTGRLSPYAEDDVSVWSAPRTTEQVVRFGFAATILPPKTLLS